MDDVLEINLDELTVAEIEIFEEITGLPFDKAFDDGLPRGKTLRALGYITKRREDPAFTLEDAGNLRISMKTADPTTAAG